MKRGLRRVLTGAIDYAGLFPPAALDMETAAASYGTHREGPHAWMLGRFVVPTAMVRALDAAAAPYPGRWPRSVLVGPDAEGARLGHDGDVVEIRVSSPDDVARARAAFPDSELYCEIAPAALDLIPAIRAAGACAKVRTGGVSAEAYPQPLALARFLEACARAPVVLKATAGLHHAVRGEYPLTYERDAPRTTMYGFLNLFAAAARAAAGAPAEALVALLEERSPEKLLATRGLERARTLVTGFGSCSFAEPVEELEKLGLL